ncbi:hypothetical protein CRENPOLYSF1_140035 [Crenothrix polyspora]|uniref:Uncharacterized protein n=1 Tax=Crenothrix polyspora TaxID=360316 RepID=A0A1R4H224_9GAMM|nr:hypothetical protein CRENPOLYSF1_140035 [Crenothrix polyspora]
MSCAARLMDDSTSLLTELRACHAAIEPPNNNMHKDESNILMFIW